jgi:DNA polymerase bacteriophage-type
VTKLYLDLETASSIPLEDGVHRYADDVRILLIAMVLDDNQAVDVEEWGELDLAFKVQGAINASDQIIAHNAEFDFTILERHGVHVPLEKRFCTMAQARSHGLPGGLEKLCAVFKVGQDKAKLKNSKQYINLFCKPQRDGTWKNKATNPKEWAEFTDYAKHDVIAMRELHRIMPRWNEALERAIWELDQTINDRGFYVDRDLAHHAVELLHRDGRRLDDRMARGTVGEVTRGTQRDRILAYLLAEYGVTLPDLSAATLERRLTDDNLPEAVKALIRIRLESAKISTSKYGTLRRCVSMDGRMRGTLVYCGANRTKRWAATKYQPHNQPRQVLPADEIEFNIRAIKAEIPELLDHSLSRCASEAIRGLTIAAPGKKLLVGDYANIEGRIAAWICGEEWKLQAFRDYDAGVGPDTYKLAYVKLFGGTLEEVDYLKRQAGKVAELMMQYGGGVGAFITGSETYRLNLEAMAEIVWPLMPRDIQIESEKFWAWAQQQKRTFGLEHDVFVACDGAKRLWRWANPKITKMWEELELAAKVAIETGELIHCGSLELDKVGAWLRIQLPSGGYLSYPAARVEHDKITFLGMSPYTRAWKRQDTWGGTLFENVVQATARDVLCCGLIACEEHGMPVVLHVHDEIVCEVPEGVYEPTILKHCMEHFVPWAEGLPIAVKAFETQRYRKGD